VRLLKHTLGQVNEVEVMFVRGANRAAQDSMRSGAFRAAITTIGLAYDHSRTQFALGEVMGGDSVT